MSAEDELKISPELVKRLKNYMNDPMYKEAVENSSSYNERLVKERKLRLPFIDAQTGVAQSDCYIWSSKLDRMPGYYSAQLYSYPARRWRKKRRQYLLTSSTTSQDELTSTNNMINMLNTTANLNNSSSSNTNMNNINTNSNIVVVNNHQLLKDGSGFEDNNSNSSETAINLNNINNCNTNNTNSTIGRNMASFASVTNNSLLMQNGNCLNQTNSSNTSSSGTINSNNTNSMLNNDMLFEDSKDSWLRNYDDDCTNSPDAGDLGDPESEYDDYEEYAASSTKKKKTKRKEANMNNNSNTPTTKKKRSEYTDSEKPYKCELCGARYKTRPGLSYHYSHSHQDNDNSSNGTIMANNGSFTTKETNIDDASTSSNAFQFQNQQIGNNSNNSNNNNNNSSNSNLHHLIASNSSSTTNHHSSHNNSIQDRSLSFFQRQIAKRQLLQSKEKPVILDDRQGDKNNSKQQQKNKRPVTPSNYCDFCLGDANLNNRTSIPEILISCTDCGRSAHPYCLNFTPKMQAAVKKYSWQCIECKSCGLCGSSDHDDQLLFCDDCDRGFHMYCLKPRLYDPPPGSWSCHLCQEEYRRNEMSNETATSANSSTTSSSSSTTSTPTTVTTPTDTNEKQKITAVSPVPIKKE